MQRHWHAYTRTGPEEELDNSAERKTGSRAFRASLLPPFSAGDWLAKPADQVAKTLHHPAEGADWLATEYGKVASSCAGPPQASVEARHAAALHALAGGLDAQWDEELLAAQYWTAAVVPCPHRTAKHPCPLPPPVEAGTP